MVSKIQLGRLKAAGRSGRIHWKAYTIMIGSLTFGVLLALGHHFFYNNLNGNPVDTNTHILKWVVSQQQLNTTIGTAFAFLVNAFLMSSVTTAYTQVIWRAIKRGNTKLATIDTIFAVVSSVWELARFSVWWKYHLLLLLACIIW
jgi:hypothetical protein